MTSYLRIFANPKIAVITALGFSSGLPLALSSSTTQAWMTVLDIDIETIGIFTLVSIPYTLKFLWAPIMDRYVPAFLGRRRGWLLITQVLLMLTIFAMGLNPPDKSVTVTALLALAVAFFSASQDIVADAYRTDVLKPHERGVGASMFVFGYRIAMLTSGALALIMSEHIGWQNTYFVISVLMAVGIVFTVVAKEPTEIQAPQTLFDAVLKPIGDFLSHPNALLLLLAIVLYKLGDAYAGSLTTPFLIRGLGFTPSDVGAINKGFGLVATIVGALVGGGILAKIGLYRALFVFGVWQALSNLSFCALALIGKNYLALIFTVAFENFTAGMGTSAFVAFLMAMCNKQYSATQYAVLSALSAIGRTLISPTSGFLVAGLGWFTFFLITTVIALPGIVLIAYLRQTIIELHDAK